MFGRISQFVGTTVRVVADTSNSVGPRVVERLKKEVAEARGGYEVGYKKVAAPKREKVIVDSHTPVYLSKEAREYLASRGL